MFVVAARAGGRVVRTGDDRLAVNTGRPFAGLLVMARAAGFRLARKINRRGRRGVGNNLVRIVTVAARRRVVMAGFQRQAVDAGLETFRLPRVARSEERRVGDE